MWQGQYRIVAAYNLKFLFWKTLNYEINELENPSLVLFLYKYYTMSVNRLMFSYSLCKIIITYPNEAYIRLRDNAGNKNVHYYNFFPPPKKKGFLNR